MQKYRILHYFKCSTHKCKAFAKIERNSKDIKEKELIITISYNNEHIYYKKDVTIKNNK